MAESIVERARRLRPLVPNCVTDRALRMRITEGWDDHQIVTHDLLSQPDLSTRLATAPRARRPRHAYLQSKTRQVERALFNA